MTRTLLMIHGVGCDGDAWSVMKPLFEAAGWNCVAPTLFPELRTREAPPAAISSLGLGDYVDAMEKEARRIEAETGAMPAMIGHSMGGLIVQKLAERGIGSAAILLTPAQPVECRIPDLRVLFTFGNIVLKNDPTLGYKVWQTGFNWGVLNKVPAAKRDAIYAKARYDSGLVYAQMGDATKDPAKIGEIDETKITMPVLTIGAVHDRATTIAAVRKVAQKYARIGGDYSEYADNAHWIVDEPGTDVVVSDIVEWLETKLPATPQEAAS
jgi:alpha-beta hydrolase superfamily lysophospholipase